MALPARFAHIVFIAATFITLPVTAAEKLTLQQTVQTALDRDALITAYQSRSTAYQDQATAEDTLPDPSIKLGLMNLPVDTFSRTQEPMTQLQLGVQQMFPRGDTLELKSQKASSMSAAALAMKQNQQRKITRDVRQTWLEYYYWFNAEKVVARNRYYFKKLVVVTRQQYAAGRQKQQDVIRSELELGMLDDRQTKIRSMVEMTRAKLAKYIGTELSQLEPVSTLPAFSLDLKNREWLQKHPMMLLEKAKVETSEKDVALARQSYKPSWMLDLTYGKREGYNPNGTARSDFVSAMVKFDLPLFTGDRQDRQVAASKQRLNSAFDMREERKRILLKMYEVNVANEKRLAERIEQYQKLLVPKARENSEAALYAYQSGRSEFEALIRAQITELETQLRALRLQVEYAKTRARLIYLVGENAQASAAVMEK